MNDTTISKARLFELWHMGRMDYFAGIRTILAEAVAQEREMCGKLCDAEANYRAERYGNPLLGDSPMIQGHKEVTARKLAAAIRARSQPQTKEDERG